MFMRGICLLALGTALLTPGTACAGAPEVITVGVARDLPPQYAIDAHGRPTGFAIDVMDAVARRMNVAVAYRVYPSLDTAGRALAEGEVDVVPNYGITDARRAHLAFTRPLERFAVQVFVRTDNAAIRGPEDLRGRRVAAVEGNVGVDLMRARPGVALHVLPTFSGAFYALLSGQVEALVYPAPLARESARQARLDEYLKSVGPPLLEVPRALAVRRDDTTLRERLDEAVAALLAAEEYRQIYLRYHGAPEPVWTPPRWLAATLGVVLVFLVVSGAWHHRSMCLTRRRAASLAEEKRHAEAALSTSEARLRSVLSASPDLVCVLDGRGGVLEVLSMPQANHGGTDTSVQAGALLGPVTEHCADAVRAALSSGTVHVVEYAVDLGEDGMRWFEGRLAPTESGIGAMQGRGRPALIMISRDITRRRHTEHLLRDTAERLELVLEGSEAGYWDWDLLSDGAYLGERWSELLGYRPSELEGRYAVWEAHLHPDDRTATVASAAALRSGASERFEGDYRLRRKGGGYIWVLGRGKVVERDADGTPLRAAGTIIDITARKQAEAALAASEERFRTIVDTAEEGIWVLDGQANTLYANRRLASLLGLPGQALEGRSLFEFVTPKHHAELNERLARRRQGQRETYQTCLVRADGEPLWAIVASAPLRDEQGRVRATLKMVTDVTARVRSEQTALRLNQELEVRVAERTAQLAAANRELEAFTYSASHDLRAPLRSLDGFGHILLEDHADRLDAEGRHLVQRMVHATATLRRLTDDLLALSRAGRAPLRREVVDLSALAEDLLDHLAREDPDRTVQVTVQPGLHLHADPGLTRIALDNLLRNAWKFTRKTPRPAIAVGATQGPGRLQVWIRDNGVGLDMAMAERIFEPFQRLHSDPAFEGSGIGLATVKRIVERHGGRLWVESAPGEGACFHFVLEPACVSNDPPRDGQPMLEAANGA
jgi:PAS domain S-box-containing protein